MALSAILILAFAVTAFARSEFSGKVVRVADGDTITVLAPGNQQVKVRLYGIDCPEKGKRLPEGPALHCRACSRPERAGERPGHRQVRARGWDSQDRRWRHPQS